MTVPGWDAQEWHRRHAKQPERPKARSDRPKQVAIAAAVMLVAGAAAVSADHVAGGPELIGVCHATGAESNPFVFLVVDKNGYEHAHHRQHDGDFFVDAAAGHCGGDSGLNATEGDALGNATSDAPAGNATSDAPAGNGSEPVADAADTGDGEGTADAAGDSPSDGNSTTATEDNATAEPGEGNATAGNGTGAPAPQSNVRVSQEATQDEFEVRLSILVESVGDAASQNVTLDDTLPDVHRTWYLGGEDHHACVLDDRVLRCWFGDLAPGDSAQLELAAYTDRMPCGYARTNTVHVDATDDGEERDNASSASIAARPC